MAQNMTKDQLKDALAEHGVDKVPVAMKKDELVALFEETVKESAGSGSGLMYSSDEEDSEITTKNKKKGTSTSSRKSSKKSSRKGGTSTNGLTQEEVSNLTNQELFAQLKAFKVDVGPIVESTRSVYEKRLLQVSSRGEENEGTLENGGQNGGQNGGLNGNIGQFSADDETDEDDQPSPVIVKNNATRTSKISTSKISASQQSPQIRISPLQKISETASTLRSRFNNPESPTNGRFTPTPRRSIHTYKVTETTKHKQIKSPDGQVSHDYSYSRSEEEDQGSNLGMLANAAGYKKFVLLNLPKFFMAVIFVCVVYYTMKANNTDLEAIWNSVINYFQVPENSQQQQHLEEVSADAKSLEREHLDDQGSITDV